MRILIIDDDPIPLRLLQALLQQQGHEVVCASDGEVGWNLFQTCDCRVVISDWVMPGLDGLELLRRIRAVGCAGAYTYVIVLTARQGRQHLDQAMLAGADDFLAKPVMQEDLMARLRVAGRIIGLQEELLAKNRQLVGVNESMHLALQGAASVQRSLLPAKLPQAPGWSFAWLSNPCDELGGDTLNIFQLDEHHLAFYILDVSGHGVSSALLAVQVSRLMTPLMSAGSLLKLPLDGPPGYRLVPPREVLVELVNAFPVQKGAPQFFTMLYGIIDKRTCAIELATAGHPGPVLVPVEGPPRLIELKGTPIGLVELPQVEFDVARLVLQPGERLVLYSDGVIEAMAADGRVFDDAGLLARLEAGRGRGLRASIDDVVAALDAWRAGAPAADDVSLLAIERTPLVS